MRKAGKLNDFVQVHRNQVDFLRVPFLGRVTGYDVRSLLCGLLVIAVWVLPRGELTVGQGHRPLALVAVFLAVLAGYGGVLAGGGHTGEGFVQEGVEGFAVLCVLVDVAHCPFACLGAGLHVLNFKPLS